MEIKLKSLIVTENTGARVRLKEALTRVVAKHESCHAQNAKEALKVVIKEQDIAAVFIHSKISQEDIEWLQTRIGDAKPKYKPIFSIMLHVDQNVSEYISKHYLSGVEGFLKEPFTTNDVNDLMEIALKNRKEQIAAEEKELQALQFMIRDAIHLVDQAALERSQQNGKGGGFPLKRMKRLKLRVRGLSEKFSVEQLESLACFEIEEQAEKLDLSKFKKRVIEVKFAEHPGVILSKVLEERSLTPERLGELLIVEDEQLFELLAGKASVNLALSKDLARILGNTEDYWLSLQSEFDEYQRHVKNV